MRQHEYIAIACCQRATHTTVEIRHFCSRMDYACVTYYDLQDRSGRYAEYLIGEAKAE